MKTSEKFDRVCRAEKDLRRGIQGLLEVAREDGERGRGIIDFLLEEMVEFIGPVSEGRSVANWAVELEQEWAMEVIDGHSETPQAG